MTARYSEDIRAWIIDQGLRGASLDEITAGFCRRLRAAGHPLCRVSVSLRTLHPKYGAHSLVWDAASDSLSKIAHLHQEAGDQTFLESPIHYLVSGAAKHVRCQLDGRPLQVTFPMVEALRTQGYTDYAATTVLFAAEQDFQTMEGIFFSCATDCDGGFSDEELTWIKGLLPSLALALKSASVQEVAVNIVEAYLGKDAGHQVLRGKFNRGSVESIDAVILIADLRGFTATTGLLPRETVVQRLNAYFDCIVQPVEQRGGQVLKFLGDGLLATFTLEDGQPRNQVCASALQAARSALTEVAKLNARLESQGEYAMPLDIALHLGDVMYGNVGAADRLDFTVIGTAVNEASRIEGLCDQLGRNLLISETFSEELGSKSGDLVLLGSYPLRGVSVQRQVFGLAEE
ncbi:adenylate/guanylate cyclase domain-containing protein [Denitrobaculum tricleocarpae]|uniref:Adenylate/guanylate cyclase domain-containing protein n=1 Tax=Denitrobaculum tricleocarpae TaxID=2591009 RepID=A0A545TRG7_9PROT|nr:adenylate/guanylate cyclase domain-containing protein [Denitrobaculum tricleocarpae]TQV79813.1 adenylate/guanylate cyclase domain-containing protein [Denitrobaculum tricleocarpae]